MRRRTLDVLFGAGALALAGLLLVLGFVMTSNANFAKDYVGGQLTEQKINLTFANTLSDEKKESACLVTYAGQQLTTGKQAECYANDFIGLHIKASADGLTYAEQSNDPALADLKEQLTAQRESLFTGETLRGLLLTSFGFSDFGAKDDQAATVASLLALLSVAGFVHAFKTSKGEDFAAPEHVTEKSGGQPLVGV